ncbi:hypothetical protein [Streptomyces sp. NPDC005012]|uniref:hypothetical protein n=1 Tax=unclassified Streptomyces TaxID=2593676 RepID=UPI0033A76B29
MAGDLQRVRAVLTLDIPAVRTLADAILTRRPALTVAGQLLPAGLQPSPGATGRFRGPQPAAPDGGITRLAR